MDFKQAGAFTVTNIQNLASSLAMADKRMLQV
jgi:hypothetical protein